MYSSKLMADGHRMGPGLQLVGAQFLNFLLGKLSYLTLPYLTFGMGGY